MTKSDVPVHPWVLQLLPYYHYQPDILPVRVQTCQYKREYLKGTATLKTSEFEN